MRLHAHHCKHFFATFRTHTALTARTFNNHKFNISDMSNSRYTPSSSSSSRRHSTHSTLSLLYRPSKPDIDLIRDLRRASISTVPSPEALSARRHSEAVPSTSAAAAAATATSRSARLSVDHGKLNDFNFTKKSFFKSADQIYNKIVQGGSGLLGVGSGSGSGSGYNTRKLLGEVVYCNVVTCCS
jgi:hypothetical protein